MSQVIDFFKKLFDTSDWPARWNCGKWTELHGWFYIISDLMVWSAYFAIPVIILRYISARKNLRFHKIYFLFAAFILACGLTHFVDAIMFWYPAYRLNGLIRFITGLASWLTVYHLFSILPTAFALKSPYELEKEVEQRRTAEEELMIKNRQLNEAQDIAKLGHWEWDVTANKLEWSHGLYKVYGVPANAPVNYDLFIQRVHPDDREYVDGLIQRAFETKVFPDYFHRLLLDDGEVRTLHAKGEIIVNSKGEIVKMLGTGQDVTDQKKAEHELLLKTQQLEAVNNELEKFAYVASHDLQEPLRKMITFTSLLEKEYKTVLGARADTFIDKITDSAKRMQNLINDILNLSRFSSHEFTYERLDLNKVVGEVLSDFEVTVQNTRADIKVDKLPVIEASESQMYQLFQNLVSNAVKFKKDGIDPVIIIKARIVTADKLPKEHLKKTDHKYAVLGNEKIWEQEKFCMLSIEDNGIGFSDNFSEKIFEVFQRLHSKQDYEGTGIGLAICKKIVANHHGTITAKSELGEGSIFTIVLPVSQRNFAPGLSID